MGWFSKNRPNCLECGEPIDVGGISPTLDKVKEILLNPILRQESIRASYSCIHENTLSLGQKGPVPDGAVVICCGTCTSKVTKFTGWLHALGYGAANPADSSKVVSLLYDFFQLSRKGDYAQARSVLNAVPDSPEKLYSLKQAYIEQVSKIENKKQDDERTLQQIEESKQFAHKGQFKQALKVVNQLNVTEDIKSKLRSQIDEMERIKPIKEKSERIVSKIKELMQNNQLEVAKKEIKSIPDNPVEFKELKRELTKQIDEYEKKTLSSIGEQVQTLTDKLNKKGYSIDKVFEIAKANNIELKTPQDLLGFLMSLDRQT